MLISLNENLYIRLWLGRKSYCPVTKHWKDKRWELTLYMSNPAASWRLVTTPLSVPPIPAARSASSWVYGASFNCFNLYIGKNVIYCVRNRDMVVYIARQPRSPPDKHATKPPSSTHCWTICVQPSTPPPHQLI